MDWRQRFPHKFGAFFTGYAETRIPAVTKELERVGLGDVQPVWQFHNAFDETIRANSMLARWLVRHPNHLSCTLAHYRIVKTAFELGYESVFVVEDDVRFLKDVRLLDEIGNSLPDDYDIALFDSIRPYHCGPAFQETVLHNKVNNHWGSVEDVRGMSCYAMSRRAMLHWTTAVEQSAAGMTPLRVCDQYLVPDLLKNLMCYVAYPNAAVQRETSSVSGTKDAQYESRGIRMSDYAD